MPRSTSLFRPLAAAALVALAFGTSATAQDEDAVVSKANGDLKAIQAKLAAGKGADDSDKPALQRLRIDKFEAKEGRVNVRGVFLDAGGKGKLDDRFGDDAKGLIVKHLKLDKEPRFSWEDVDVYDADVTLSPDHEAPFVTLQNAAAAAKLDQVYLTGNRFGPGGELVLTGSWAKGSEKALTDLWTDKDKGVLTKHPIAAAGKAGAPAVSFSELKVQDAWPLSAAAARAALAGSDQPALRRTRADRVYLTYSKAAPRLNVEGVRLGQDKFEADAVKTALEALWKDVVSRAAATVSPDIVNELPDPAADVQAAVAKNRALDGVRVDAGAEFDKDGNLLLAGLKPDATNAKADDVAAAYKAVVTAKAAAEPTRADRYKRLAAGTFSTAAMKPIAWNELYADMRQWAKDTRDDVRFRRLAFAADPKDLGPGYATAKGGGGLVLAYQATSPADVKAVAAEFERAFARRFQAGLPDAPKPAADADAPKADAKAGGSDAPGAEGPLVPSLTAELRALVAAGRALPPKENPWFGVLLSRGYFDADDKYRLDGVVDNAGQNALLQKELEKRKADPKWADYFRPATGKDDVVPPKLEVISMRALLDRVQRVTPGYADFDGLRVENAYYDEALRLTFQAHSVGKVTPDMVGKLADLIKADPTYKKRVAPSAATEPAKVRIQPLAGPAYADDQVANFSLAYGAKLLNEAGASKAARAKAKAWLDVATLHYPNESAVWYLSARYNLLDSDAPEKERNELVRRDLYRVVELEGPLAFNGPAQRKRRYEAAKDFQGEARAELEARWLEAFREVKDGAKPIALTGGN
jgi:hypothetical protein